MRYVIKREKSGLAVGKIPKYTQVSKIKKGWTLVNATNQKAAINKFAKKEISAEKKYNKKVGLW